MTISRRTFSVGGAVVVAVALMPAYMRAAVPPKDEALVLARATDVDLSAQETAVMLAPVPPPRRPPQKAKLAKGEKPPAPRTWIVLRDVVAADRSPAYDLSLVLEGPDVFRPTTTSQPVGALEFNAGGGEDAADRNKIFAFDVSEALARLSKTRGFNMRYLRLTIVRRPVTDAPGKEKSADEKADNDTAPSFIAPPEIGTIELVRW